METGKGIKLKFCSHQKRNYREAELLVNVKDMGSNVKEGDILEIYHPDEDEHQSRLLLQIPHYDKDISFTKDTISVEQNIASSFQLRPYKDVIVNKVDPKSVALELLELTFKDQYLGRSDMWRLKMSLVNTVTYLNKMIEFCCNSIRCQTYEMWAHGEKVSCGVITEDTKIVFRSSTCQAYLFIQMSSEMWEFDMYGDLYFEKAVNGFLAELFTKWKKEGSNHDVTIVLFSRTYYKANSIEVFPLFMRECLMEDYQGRFYEDFYRVAVQSERYEDWMPILSHLRQLFHSYLEDVLEYHSSPDYSIPEAYNSNAPQGNFLEVLNISLNVFEKHFLDRSFERTGQMSVVITPGVGVFEVDRELTNITKQRIIDNGVGSDLVCLGVQPLHAVPLLKFHKKRGSLRADDYSMPHTWINLSFYSSKKRVLGSSFFVPRIKVPQEILRVIDNGGGKPAYPTFSSSNSKSESEERIFSNSVYDYDAYDAHVFKIPTNQHNRTYKSLQRPPARKKTTSQSSSQPPPRVNYQRKLSDPDLFRSSESMTTPSLPNKMENVSNFLAKSPAINIPCKIVENKTCSHSFGALNIEGLIERKLSVHSEVEDMSPSRVSKIGSSGTNSPNELYQTTVGKKSVCPGRSLINPFNPSHITVKRTSNQRRWIHTFPKGPTGFLIQQHHYQMSSVNLSEEEDLGDLENEEKVSRIRSKSYHQSHDSLNMDEPLTNGHTQRGTKGKQMSTYEGWPIAGTSFSSSVASTRCTSSPQKYQSPYSQGVQPPPMPGVIQHTSSVQINKHATLLWGATGEQEWSAAITTGVDWKSLTLPACLPLTTDYFPVEQSLQYDYEVAANYSRLPESLNDSFLEMVSQRLSQGFQLIMRTEEVESTKHPHSSLVRARRSKVEEVLREYKLSIGRFIHWLKLKECSIDVTIYRPKHPYPSLERPYKFRFRSPYLGQYQVSSGEFKTERLENYKWNDLDSYICFKGDLRECCLVEEFKYWRFRLIIVPDLFKAETKRLLDSPPGTRCDIYGSITFEEHNIVDNIIKFLEVIHRIKRPGNSKKGWGTRERLGSMRMERPRVRPANKVSDRVRFESGNKDKEELVRGHNDGEEEFKEEGEIRKLNQGMSMSAVVEAMKDPSFGVPVITTGHTPLPSFTFLSYDATVWVVRRFEDIPSQAAAVAFLQKLVDKELIQHVSGNSTKLFQNGFHIYYIPIEGEVNSVDLSSFEAEWHEISIAPLPNKTTNLNNDFAASQFESLESSTPIFDLSQDSSKEADVNENRKEMYKSGYLEIDWNNRSDRYEWGHLSYQVEYHPLQCYELIVKWMCATGTIVNDLILSWQRKAANLCLHLFPVPMEPFVLPFTFNSNPLRSPIVIPLNSEALKDPSFSLIELLPNTREQKIALFQKLILERFGFMCHVTVMDGESKKSYVHATGNMIVLISTLSDARTTERHKTMSAVQKSMNELEPERRCPQPCFLWTFNYMLTRRWKSSTSGDEALGEMILRDFKEFCANRNQRLKELWDSFLASMTPLSLSAQPFVDVCMQ